MSEDKKNKHNLTMLDRNYIKAEGIIDVISFDEEMIVAQTQLGVMILKGVDFHITKLDLERGELEVTGEVISLVYDDKVAGIKSGGFLSKLFK